MHRETTPECLQQAGTRARRTATLSSPNERRAGSITTSKLDEERRRMSALTRIARWRSNLCNITIVMQRFISEISS